MSWEICKGDMRFFEPSDSVNTTPMLLTLLDPVAFPVNSSRNTRARAEEPPGEMIMIVLFGYDLIYYIPSLNTGFPRIMSHLPRL